MRNDFDRACLNLGRLKEEQGALAEAELWYRRGAELKPGIRTHWLHLAGALGKQSKWAEVERVLRQTVDVEPDNLDLQVNLAYALIQRERLEEAAAIYHSVLAQRPGYHEIHSNLAFVRERQGRFDEALSATRRGIELRPDYPEAYNNLGIVLRSLHRLDEASEAFRKALELRADFPLAAFNLGTTRLLAGDYAGGWLGYRYARRIVEEVAPARDLPEWNGVPIPGKSLLVYDDQGFGDTIQFAAISFRLSGAIRRTDLPLLPIGTNQPVCRPAGCRRTLRKRRASSGLRLSGPHRFAARTLGSHDRIGRDRRSVPVLSA